MKKEITINGKKMAAAFNMSTLLAFENFTDTSFFSAKFEKMKERLALVLAAVYAADNDADITIEDLLGSDNWPELITAFSDVMEMAGEFFHLPKVVADAEQKERGDADDTKETDEKN